jgi:hypothetical protein
VDPLRLVPREEVECHEKKWSVAVHEQGQKKYCDSTFSITSPTELMFTSATAQILLQQRFSVIRLASIDEK